MPAALRERFADTGSFRRSILCDGGRWTGIDGREPASGPERGERFEDHDGVVALEHGLLGEELEAGVEIREASVPASI